MPYFLAEKPITNGRMDELEKAFETKPNSFITGYRSGNPDGIHNGTGWVVVLSREPHASIYMSRSADGTRLVVDSSDGNIQPFIDQLSQMGFMYHPY